MLNDGDCGFCMRTAALVPRLGVDIDASTIQAVDLDAMGVEPSVLGAACVTALLEL